MNPVIRTPIAIGLGAIAGALSRYYLGLWLTQLWGTEFPYGTFIINITGCFGMGLLAIVTLTPPFYLHPDLRLLLTTGFLGSYTTFSSYELDAAKLWQKRSFEADLLYWSGSAILGLVSLQLGIVLAEVALKLVNRGTKL